MIYFFQRCSTTVFVSARTATCVPDKWIQVTKPRDQEASTEKLVTRSGVLYETKKVCLVYSAVVGMLTVAARVFYAGVVNPLTAARLQQIAYTIHSSEHFVPKNVDTVLTGLPRLTISERPTVSDTIPA